MRGGVGLVRVEIMDGNGVGYSHTVSDYSTISHPQPKPASGWNRFLPHSLSKKKKNQRTRSHPSCPE